MTSADLDQMDRERSARQIEHLERGVEGLRMAIDHLGFSGWGTDFHHFWRTRNAQLLHLARAHNSAQEDLARAQRAAAAAELRRQELAGAAAAFDLMVAAEGWDGS